jgi:hypothetical protein
MTRDEVIALLAARDPIAAAADLPVPGEVTWVRGEADGDGVEVLRYGAGTTDAQVADRLLEIAAAGGAVRSVQLIPGPDSGDRPGSWGVEDLLVTAVARRVLPDVAIRPDWPTLGASACQVAVSFGASEWVIPDGDDTDPDHLAQAVGARAVAR